jgi:cyclophilin family peptidyl-prolyl cis-trans isomerase/HEAT repeat protein
MISAVYLKNNRATPQNYIIMKIAVMRTKCLNFICKGIVKLPNYSHFLVSSVFLISSCTSPNKFNTDAVRQVQTFADERKSDAVITYFTHEDWHVREQAAIVFGSIHDSLGIEGLLNLSEFDSEPKVRMAAAFALGQYRINGILNLLIRRMKEESNKRVKHELIVAVGKCGGLNVLMNELSGAENDLVPSLAEGIFYGIAKGDTLSGNYAQLVLLLENTEAQFYAAASLARLKDDLSNSKTGLTRVFENCSDEDTRFQLAQILGRMISKHESELIPLFQNEKSDLVRVGFMNGNARLDSLISTKILLIASKDPSAHVRQRAAETFLQLNDVSEEIDFLKMASTEVSAITKYLLLESALKFSKTVERRIRISEQLSLELNKSNDEYVTGFILKALCAWDANFQLVENFSFKSTSIIVRGAGIFALISSYQQKIEGKQTQFSALLHKGLRTKDVAVASMCAEAMLQKDLYQSPNVEEDLNILESVLTSMRLPRDMETYGSLLKAIRFLQDKPVSGSFKPEFNNPIDWELALRIPKNQEVKISTNRGEVTIELWIDEAPGSVTQFVKLIKNEFYSNKRLHRVVPGFVIQDGCPRGDGYGSTMETVRSEFSPSAKFERGTLGFASAGEDTESCQWFITHTRTPHLNGRYSAFGRVTKGMEVVQQLILGDEIKTIELIAP